MSKTKVKWKKGRFWPGYSWRILAHNRYDKGVARESSYHQDHQVAISSEDYDNPIEFDELVIDHWLHIEQMNDREWWIGLGNWHINVYIDGNGVPQISSYENESEEKYAAYVERVRLAEPWKSPPAPILSSPMMPQTKND